MDIKIDGNPGTGNTFQEIIFEGPIQNVNPNATTVINYNYGKDVDATKQPAQKEDVASAKTKSKKQQEEVEDKPHIRKEILQYVDKVSTLVHPDYQDKYKKMWEGILDLNAVKPFLCRTGKQKKTNFNRTLIARILHHLSLRHLFAKPYTPSDFARALEGKYEASVRGELGKFPSDYISSEIDKYLESIGIYTSKA
jgi:hypothetical protein